MLNMIIQNVDQLLSLPFNEVVKEISNLPHTFDAPEAISKFAKHYGVNPDYLIGRGLYPLLSRWALPATVWEIWRSLIHSPTSVTFLS